MTVIKTIMIMTIKIIKMKIIIIMNMAVVTYYHFLSYSTLYMVFAEIQMPSPIHFISSSLSFLISNSSYLHFNYISNKNNQSNTNI